MLIGVPKEIKDHEYRVSVTPDGVRLLREAGHEVLVEPSAGQGSGFTDEDYRQAGAHGGSLEGRRLSPGGTDREGQRTAIV